MEKQPTNNKSVSGILKTYWKLLLGIFLIIAWMNNAGSIFFFAGLALVILYFADIRTKAKQGQGPEQPEEPQTQSAPSVGQLFSAAPAKPEEYGDEWVCEKCGATNRGSVCEYCDSPREEPEK